ncbi:MAG: AAA family ATPase [Acidimicrobiales bacterium]
MGVEHPNGTVGLPPAHRQLLALLVAAGPEGASSEWLANEFWLDTAPGHWSSSVRVAVSRLRRRSGLAIPSVDGRYRLQLDRTAVDLWRLEDVANGAATNDAERARLLGSPEVFPGLELSPALIRAETRAIGWQSAVIGGLANDGAPHDRAVLSALFAHLAHRPLEDHLAAAVVAVCLAAGAVGDAGRLVATCRAARADDMDDPTSASLDAAERAVAAAGPGRFPLLEPSSGPPPAPRLPADLDRRRAPHVVGQTAALDRIDRLSAGPTGPAIIIRGPSGSGKSALLAEAGDRITAAGSCPVSLTGTAGGRVGFASIVAGVRGFDAEIELANELRLDPAARRGHLGLRLRARLQELAAGRPVAVFVDDAHLLDTGSCDLLELLCRHEVEPRTTVVFAAPTDAEACSPWRELEDRLMRWSARTIDVEPLTTEDLITLAGVHRPELSLATRSQLGRWLRTASAGLPMVALALLRLPPDLSADLDPADQALDVDEVQGVFQRLVLTVSPKARIVGAVGALLGQRFQASELADLVGDDEADLFASLDELVACGHLAESGRLDQFEFTHRMIRAAFWRTMTVTRRAHFHLRASALTTDPHALADHHHGAGHLIPLDDRVAAVLRSARVHLAAGSFWESVWQFRRAVGLTAEGLDSAEPTGTTDPTGPVNAAEDPADLIGTADLIDYARALARCGSRVAAATIRRQAFTAAARDDDWATALAVALSALPESEIPDGEADRLDQLLSIPTGRLDRPDQLGHALATSRIAVQLGRQRTAARWAGRAADLAATDEERGAVILAERFAGSVLAGPAERLDTLAAADPLEPGDRLRCRLAEFRTIDLLETGRLVEARSALDDFNGLAHRCGDPLRIWHALLFRSLMAELDGQWGRADELADEARTVGRGYGIGDAEIVRLAQGYFRLRSVGRLAELSEAIELIPEADAGLQLFQSARATVHLAAGHHEQAVEEATRLATEVLDRPSPMGVQSTAIALPVLVHVPDAGLKRDVLRTLRRLRTGGLIVGAGLGMLPFMDLELAGLSAGGATDRSRRLALERAVGHADRTGLRSLAVTARLELATLAHDDRYLAEAGRLAAGTSLSAVGPASIGPPTQDRTRAAATPGRRANNTAMRPRPKSQQHR